MKYRKKPVVIEAVRVEADGSINGHASLTAPWLTEALAHSRIRIVDGELLIATLEGVTRADPGDWIIRGVKGELYPCRPDIFALTYEACE